MERRIWSSAVFSQAGGFACPDLERILGVRFPDDQYAASANEHIPKCLKSLAGNDYYIGQFYFNSKHYEAALKRFMSVLTNYPDVGYHQKALQYIAKCEASLAKETEETKEIETQEEETKEN